MSNSKILIAVDATSSSDAALDVGLDLIGVDAEVLVLSVDDLQPPRLSPLGMLADTIEPEPPLCGDDGPRADNDAMANSPAAADIARSAAEALNADAALAMSGDPGTIIVDTAKSQEVDLLIIGRSERGSIARFFTSSVSQYVIDNAPCSVLVAR